MVILEEPSLDGRAKHCVTEFCFQLGKSRSESLLLIHQDYGDDEMSCGFQVVEAL
jgi:hypothetical protein